MTGENRRAQDQGGAMVLVLRDDGPHVYPSRAAVEANIEALDADEIHYAVDEFGQRYRVEWIKRNRRGRLLGLLPWVANGVYRLVVDGTMNGEQVSRVIEEIEGWLPELADRDRQHIQAFLARLRQG